MELGTLEKVLRPIQRKLRLLATRGVVKLVNPATLLQELQIAALGDEVLDRIEHWEPYGYTSRPLAGAEALLLSLGADRDHTVAVNVADRRFRLKGLLSGEVALYTDEGDVIHFKRGNELLIDTMGTLVANAGTSATVTSPLVNVTASTKCTIDSPLTEVTTDLQVGGDLAVGGNQTVTGTLAATGAISSAASVGDPTGTMADMRTTYNGHTHKENDVGGQTDAALQQM